MVKLWAGQVKINISAGSSLLPVDLTLRVVIWNVIKNINYSHLKIQYIDIFVIMPSLTAHVNVHIRAPATHFMLVVVWVKMIFEVDLSKLIFYNQIGIINKKTFFSFSLFQCVVRVCCIRSFGHFLTNLQGNVLHFNPEAGIFTSISQSKQDNLEQQAKAQFRMVSDICTKQWPLQRTRRGPLFDQVSLFCWLLRQ